MLIVNSFDKFHELIQNNKVVLFYFSSYNCSVCKVLKPKVIDLLKKYPKIEKYEVETENSIELSAQLNIYSAPALLFFIDGKEVIREIRHISIDNLELKIARYYNLVVAEF